MAHFDLNTYDYMRMTGINLPSLDGLVLPVVDRKCMDYYENFINIKLGTKARCWIRKFGHLGNLGRTFFTNHYIFYRNFNLESHKTVLLDYSNEIIEEGFSYHSKHNLFAFYDDFDAQVGFLIPDDPQEIVWIYCPNCLGETIFSTHMDIECFFRHTILKYRAQGIFYPNKSNDVIIPVFEEIKSRTFLEV